MHFLVRNTRRLHSAYIGIYFTKKYLILFWTEQVCNILQQLSPLLTLTISKSYIYTHTLFYSIMSYSETCHIHSTACYTHQTITPSITHILTYTHPYKKHNYIIPLKNYLFSTSFFTKNLAEHLVYFSLLVHHLYISRS